MATAYVADVPSVKVEAGGSSNGQGPQIKPDPDSLATLPHSDEDIYEDAGDLDFADAEQSVYLTKIPKFLWEIWSKLDDNQEIEIGRVKVEGQPGDVKRVSSLLR